jgi:hypothetical protein
MKGYELYSWPLDGEWQFVLLTGTNRLKTFAEVSSSDGVVQGVEALKGELARLPEGESVFWSAWRVAGTHMPPDGMVDAVRRYCEEIGVEFHVDGAPSEASAAGDIASS